MDVIVVGGADSLIQGAYGSKMRANGVNIKWHEPQASRLDTIPQAAQGVVIIKDMVSYALAGTAITLAKNRGIPFVQVTRKFSHAVQIMRASGFIASQPSTFTVTPLTPATTPVTTTTATTTTDQDFETAVDMVFREDPYLAKRPSDFAFRVQDLTGGSVFSTQIDQALQRRLDHLRGLRGLRGDPASQEYRAQIRQRWMVAFMEEFLIEQGSLPKYKEIYEEAKHYFGATLDAGTIQRYLAIVTGNQPVDVTAQAQAPQEQAPAAVVAHNPDATEDGIVTLNVDRWASIQGMFSQLLEGQAEHLRVIKSLTEQSADLQSEVAYLRGRVTDLNMQVGCLRDSVSTSLSEAESEFGDRLTALEAASQPDTVGPALAQLVASGLSIRIEAK